MIPCDQYHRLSLLPTRYQAFNKWTHDIIYLVMFLITTESHGHIYGLWFMEYSSVSSASPAYNSLYYGSLRFL